MLDRVLFQISCVAFAALLSPASLHAQACGDPQTPCTIEGGSYHVIYPEVPEPLGIVMHLHGGGSTGASALKSGLAGEAHSRGYIFVAPNGEHPEARWTKDWSVRADNMEFERDDAEFLARVLTDIRSNTDLSEAPVLLSGFSRGGSMVWNMACWQPEFADAYAPLAGAFWERLPTRCMQPVYLFHTHGWTDRVVPLEGRSFFDDTVVQGDVWASLKVLRETNGCGKRQPETSTFDGELWLRHWTDCDAGRIDLMLHKGGHSAPEGWGPRMLDWFEELELR